MGRLPPAARAALKRAWTGGYWSRARLADVGLVDAADCDKCGARRDDAYHRIWECECAEVKAKREAATTPEMRAEAARVARDDYRYTRGLMPSPWNKCAPPRSDHSEMHVDGDLRELTQPLIIDRPVFIDGSALWPSNPEARRAGWAIVMINEGGGLVGAIYGHLPWAESDEQTAGHAEMYALRRAVELAIGDLVVYTDYKEAADGVLKGEAATTSAGMKHAAHWRAFWRAVDDSSPTVVKVQGHITEAEVAHDVTLQCKRAGTATPTAWPSSEPGRIMSAINGPMLRPQSPARKRMRTYAHGSAERSVNGPLRSKCVEGRPTERRCSPGGKNGGLQPG